MSVPTASRYQTVRERQRRARGKGTQVVASTPWAFTLLARGLACPPSMEGGRIGHLETSAKSRIEVQGGQASPRGRTEWRQVTRHDLVDQGSEGTWGQQCTSHRQGVGREEIARALEGTVVSFEVEETAGQEAIFSHMSLRRAGVGAGLRGPKCRNHPRKGGGGSPSVLPPTVPRYVLVWSLPVGPMSTHI